MTRAALAHPLPPVAPPDAFASARVLNGDTFDRATVQALIDACTERMNDLWTRRIEEYAARVAAHFDIVSRGLDVMEEFDLDSDDGGILFESLHALVRLGVVFDPTFILRWNKAERHMVFFEPEAG